MTVGSTRAEGQGRLFGAAGRNAGLGRGIGSGRQRSRGAQVGMSENEGGGGGGGGLRFLMELGQLKCCRGQNFAIIAKFKPCTCLQNK